MFVPFIVTTPTYADQLVRLRSGFCWRLKEAAFVGHDRMTVLAENAMESVGGVAMTGAVTVNVPLVARPPAVMTEIVPVTALLGTMAVI